MQAGAPGSRETCCYLSQLVDLEKWAAEFNLSVDQLNSQIERWQADFDASIGEMLGEYQGVPTLENQKYQTSVNQWNQESELFNNLRLAAVFSMIGTLKKEDLS